MRFSKVFFNRGMIPFFFSCLFIVLLLNLHHSNIDYFIIRTSEGGLAKFCGSKGFFSCHKTLLSGFSDLGSGFPTSEIALLYFFFLAAVLHWNALQPLRKIFSLFGIFASVFFLSIMLIYLKTLCSSCLLIHGSHLLLCGTVLWKEQVQPSETSKTWIAPAVLTFAVSLQLTVLYDFFWIKDLRPLLQRNRSAPFEEQGEMSAVDFQKLTEQATPLYPDQKITAETPTVFMFFDFQCPYCKESLNAYETWRQASGKIVNIQILPFPLERTCNPSYIGPDYSGSCLAMESFQCLKRQGQWPLHRDDLIRDSKFFFKESSVLKSFSWGRKTAWDVVGTCVTQEQNWIQQETKKVQELADGLGITGTPVFLKIKRVEGKYQLFQFDGAISIHGWERM